MIVRISQREQESKTAPIVVHVGLAGGADGPFYEGKAVWGGSAHDARVARAAVEQTLDLFGITCVAVDL